jgi:transposase InsO family protein
MRRSPEEKMEIIRLVEQSDLGAKRTLAELGIPRSTFYGWYQKYLTLGYDGLEDTARASYWNVIPTEYRAKVIETALEITKYSPRELAWHMTDNMGHYISESSVYRILKAAGLITSPNHILLAAASKYKNKTTRINQMWQTDFTYLKVIGWGWYYLSTVLDDYSRYIIHYELCSNMETQDVKRNVDDALLKTGLSKERRPRILSDNGPCYISKDLIEFMKDRKMKHIRGRPLHPQTQGKIERYHRTLKNVVKLENYFFPESLIAAIEAFVDYYNNQRYHESLENCTPADVYFGRQQKILNKRLETKNEIYEAKTSESSLANGQGIT